MNELYPALQDKIQLLIDRCRQLEQENARLQASEQNWRSERAQLIEKNDLVRGKVESMINRLRALEQSR